MSITITTTSLRFEIIKEIGQNGRNSEVFLARDHQLDCEIAVKKIPKSKFSDADKYFDEARRLNTSEHNNVMPVKFGSSDDDFVYIGMPFYVNGCIKDLIDKKFLSVREIVRYAFQFLSGLNHIHVKQLIHFDIKPDNIMLTATNEAVVADFGQANHTDLFGTAEVAAAYFKHLPPEYFTTSRHTMLFDIYSAGVTLYRMCNGNRNFYDQLNALGTDRHNIIHAIKMGKFPDRDTYLPHIPKKLQRIIKKATKVDVNHRYQTVIEMMNELSDVDELLDWQYFVIGDTREWTRTDDERKISILLNKLVNSRYELNTTKTIFASGRTTKISDYCFTDLETTAVEQKVTEILLAHE